MAGMTKAQLQAELARVRVENENLRDMVAAISETVRTPMPDRIDDRNGWYAMRDVSVVIESACEYAAEHSAQSWSGRHIRESVARALKDHPYATTIEAAQVLADKKKSAIA